MSLSADVSETITFLWLAAERSEETAAGLCPPTYPENTRFDPFPARFLTSGLFQPEAAGSQGRPEQWSSLLLKPRAQGWKWSFPSPGHTLKQLSRHNPEQAKLTVGIQAELLALGSWEQCWLMHYKGTDGEIKPC